MENAVGDVDEADGGVGARFEVYQAQGHELLAAGWRLRKQMSLSGGFISQERAKDFSASGAPS